MAFPSEEHQRSKSPHHHPQLYRPNRCQSDCVESYTGFRTASSNCATSIVQNRPKLCGATLGLLDEGNSRNSWDQLLHRPSIAAARTVAQFVGAAHQDHLPKRDRAFPECHDRSLKSGVSSRRLHFPIPLHQRCCRPLNAPGQFLGPHHGGMRAPAQNPAFHLFDVVQPQAQS